MKFDNRTVVDQQFELFLKIQNELDINNLKSFSRGGFKNVKKEYLK